MTGPALVVLLGGEPIGEVRRTTGRRMEFRYEAGYGSDPDAVPLSVSMPLSQLVHPDSVITPWLWGLLPDGEDVRREWANEHGVSAQSPFDLLSTPIGHDCAGAVQFCAPSEVNWLVGRGGGVNPLTEHGVAERLRVLQSDETAWWDRSLRLQFSLGGGQRKTALHLADGVWGVPWGETPTTHILKPGIHGLRRAEINEHLCLTTARLLGLPAAHTSLQMFEDQVAVVVRRFDRLQVDGTLFRFHQEDLCQALAVHPVDKYEFDGGPGAADVVGVLRSHAVGHAESDVTRFVDCLALNWLLGTPDAHAKNYSLLIEAHQARLSPLYDVISGLPYRRGGEHKIRLAMRVGDNDRLGDIRPRDWLDTARRLRVRPASTIERIVDMAVRLPKALEEAASDPAVRAIDADFADDLLDRVTAWSKQCAAELEVGLSGPASAGLSSP